ncbi:MAG: hypothetical protein ACLFN0_10295 [Thermovirgaceae bacterium]
MLEGERVLGVLGGTMKLGLFKTASMAMIVTSRRLVFAEVTNDMVVAEAERIRKQSAAEKPGFFGRMAMALNANKELLAGLGQCDPDEIAAGGPKNFVIPLESVIMGRVSGKEKFHSDGEYQKSETVVLVKTADKKYELVLQGATAKPADILSEALGTRFRKGLFK